MGMFTDHTNTKRTEWTFKYLGADLLPAATRLYTLNAEAETKARTDASKLMLDPAIGHSDAKVVDAKKLIEKHGLLKEQLSVWVHEFKRFPEREYTLGLGDVTFFELEKADAAPTAT